MPPKGRPPLTDDEAAVLTWWVEAGVPAVGTLRTLQAPAEVRVAFSRSLPADELRAVEELQRRQAAEYETTLAKVRAAVPGSLRAIVPGERDLEYSAAVAGATFGDAELEKLSAAGKDLLWLDLSRTRITDAGLKTLANDAEPAASRPARHGGGRRRPGRTRPAPRPPDARSLRHRCDGRGPSSAAPAPWLAAALCRRYQSDAPWCRDPSTGTQGAANLDYPSQHSMKGSRVLLIASVLPVALVAAAAATVRVLAQGRPDARASRDAWAGPPGHHLLQPAHPSDPGRQLPELPRIRSGQTGSGASPRSAGVRLRAADQRTAGDRQGRPRTKCAHAAHHVERCRHGDAAAGDAQDPPPARHCDPRALDQGGCEVRAALGLHQARAPGTPRCAPVGIRVEPHRPLRAGAPGSSGPHAQPGGRSPHPDPAGHARPDGADANPRGDRRVRSRLIPAGVRNAGRPAACPSELRRAPGALLARRRALRRHARVSLRQLPQHLAVPRLGDRRLQRQPALRPVHAGTDRRRLVARRPRPIS